MSLKFAPVFTHLAAAICGSGDSFATAGGEAPGVETPGVGAPGVKTRGGEATGVATPGLKTPSVERSGLEAPCAVVDMEAYALAKACWRTGAGFACAKYVTDGADHAAAADWQNNVHKAAGDFLELYRAVRDRPDRAILAR